MNAADLHNFNLAIKLARSGLPVFPCLEADGLAMDQSGKPKRAKAPYTATGFQDASTDEHLIQKWWSQWPNAVPGLPTGATSGISVIDGDIDRETGEAVGETQIAALNLDHPDAVHVRTQSGGIQILYRHIEGARTKSKQAASNVDTRGEGGYIIAPGARMQNGASYQYTGRTLSAALAAGNLPLYPLAAVAAAEAARAAEKNGQASGEGEGRSAGKIDTGFDFRQTEATDSETMEVVRRLLAEAPNSLGREDWVKLAVSLRVAFGQSLRDVFTDFSLRYIGATPCTVHDADQVWQSSGAPHTVSGIAPALALLKRAVGPVRFKAVFAEVFAETRDGSDWTHVAARSSGGAEGAQRKAHGAGDAASGPERADTDPVDLWGNFAPPELPQGLLPRVLDDFARANGDQMGADPAGLAVAALVVCAAAIPDRIKIKVKRYADWTESARLWAALVGPPSAKKSPILSAAASPLCRLDGQMVRDWQREMAEWNKTPKDERVGPAPPQKRLRIEDTTVEAAQQVLEGSPDGVLCLQDELGGFFGAMDKYNGGKGASADRAFWLRSFNGGEFALNRVGRGASVIDNLSVSMLGGIQPEPLRKIAGDSVDDGLLQRLFPIMLRPATMGRDEPMPRVNDKYRDLIEALNKLPSPGWQGQGVLEFSAEAQAVRRDLEERHLKLQSLETVNRKLASHIGKYDGLFARLCVVWHCVEHVERTVLADTGPSEMRITVDASTARRVADFLHGFLLRHAFALYAGVLGLSDDHDRLTAVAGFILSHGKTVMTNRDVQRGDRTMRGITDREIRPIFEQLATLGWLEMAPNPRPTLPPHWIVNPAVHVKFADRAKHEARRRAEAREAIAGVGQEWRAEDAA